MSIDIASHFIRTTPIDPASGWDVSSLTELSLRSVPDIFFRDRATLLKADQTRLWLRWFLESLATPWAFISDESKGKLHVFEAVLKNIQLIYPTEEMSLKQSLADAVTEHLYAEIQRRRSAGRDIATNQRRRELIESSQRCYLCGYSFTPEAIDAFLRVRGRNPVTLPPLVDLLRPRGLITRDIKIEIEHLVPVAAGGIGQANLCLACGWCNRYKGAKTSMYDASFSAARTKFRLGPHTLYELPEPFWSIRLLAIHPRCQHDGCQATTASEEVFVALRDWEGSPNPTNLRFFCANHDPISTSRFMSPRDAERIWKDRIQ